LCAGAMLLGAAADRLRPRGIPPRVLLGWAAVVFIVAQTGLIAGWHMPSSVLWAVIAGVGGATVLSYAILAEYFSKEIAGQANAALNVLHIGGACVVQYAIGFVIELWPSRAGHFPPIAYKTAFGLTIVLQIAALAWFLRPHEGRATGRTPVAPTLDQRSVHP
jgi:MFS family permease